MRTLYLECSMGAAGDMIIAALLELIDDKTEFLKRINSLLGSLETTSFKSVRVKIKAESVLKSSIKGTRIHVDANGLEESPYSTAKLKRLHKRIDLREIKNIISRLQVSEKIKRDSLSIYEIIGKAEARVHSKTVDQIHFHEVGALDAVADIVSTCLLVESVAPKEIIASPINVGSGFVRCVHGVLPVPAPATAEILRHIPIYSTDVHDELCTPTGAAIIKHFATHFTQMPNMCVHKIGYGMGAKNFKALNCLRAFLGKTNAVDNGKKNNIAQLQCNLDDMTGEATGFVFDLLFQKGALDVFTIPIQMKKNRPAILLTCLCDIDKADFFVELLFRHTTTFGVRKMVFSRYVLKCTTLTRQTKYGNVRIKIGEGYNVQKSKPEYDDIARVALLSDVSLDEARKTVADKKKKYEYKAKVRNIKATYC